MPKSFLLMYIRPRIALINASSLQKPSKAETKLLIFMFDHVWIWSHCCNKTLKFELNLVQLVVIKPLCLSCVCVLCLSFDLNICWVLFRLPMITFPVDWSRLEAPVWLVGEAGNIRFRAAGSPWGHTILSPPVSFDVYLLCNIKSRLNMFSHWYSLSCILSARH